MADVRTLLEPSRRLHAGIRQAVLQACQQAGPDNPTRVAREGEGDTIYVVDRVSEDFMVEFFEREVASDSPLILIAEGLPQGQLVLPRGKTESEAVWRVLVDPIDGTRGLMYQKRSAWILTGVAPNRGPETNLQDIELAVQTEIPLAKQHLADCLWAVRGQGVGASARII